MLNYRLTPAKGQLLFQRNLSTYKHTFKPLFKKNAPLAIRLASTQHTPTGNQSKQNKPTYTDTRKPRINFVKVDSPFAKANKFAYVMPQDPHFASERLTNILEKGTINDAIDYVKALPLDLQSAVVWNHLIGHCAQHGKAKLAEQSYIEMRKRGMSPNDRTFTLMISAYSKSTTPNAIEKAEDWLKKMKNFDIKPSIIHINNLLKVYNHAGQPLKTIKLLDEMPARRILPDVITYSIALRACSDLEEPGQAARNIRRIWQNIVNRLEENPLGQRNNSLQIDDLNLKIDDALVVSLLTAISRTSLKESDMLPGIEAVHKLYSLYPPQAAALMEKHIMVGIDQHYGFGFQPSVKAFHAILGFCGKLKQYTLAKEYYELTLQQYPRLKPDKYVDDTYSWIEKMLKRRSQKRVYKRT